MTPEEEFYGYVLFSQNAHPVSWERLNKSLKALYCDQARRVREAQHQKGSFDALRLEIQKVTRERDEAEEVRDVLTRRLEAVREAIDKEYK